MLDIVFWFFVVIVAIQFVYYIIIFGKFSFAKKQHNTAKKLPVSVIVCAKNEEENVKKFIPLLAKQNYPDYEIVLIDDASRDETLEIFEAFEKQYSNIKLVKVENNEAFWRNKNFALTLGIKAAKNEYLVFIDADCHPDSEDWLKEITACFSAEKKIVLGYGATPCWILSRQSLKIRHHLFHLLKKKQNKVKMLQSKDNNSHKKEEISTKD